MSSQGDYGYVQDGTYTAGHSGSEASRDRAVTDERTGRGRHRREQVLKVVRLSGLEGKTWYEVAGILDIHHGAASGALSNLHKAGRLECLKERRGGAHVYVLPHLVNGRATRPFGRVRAATPEVGVQEPLAYPSPQTADLERRIEDTETALAAEATDAYDHGHDDGWQTGYDAAMEVALRERSGSTAYQEGLTEGAKRGRMETARKVREIAVGMQNSLPSVTQSHHSKCWMQHPACALNSIRLAAERIITLEGGPQ